MTLSIQLLTYWKPYTSSPLDGKLEVGRRDGWKSLGKGEGRELTVIEAYVRGTVQLEGTRRVVGAYPNLAGALSSAIFFITATLGVGLCFWRFAAPFEAGYRRAPKGGMPLGPTGPAGRPLPPRPMPKTSDRRPRTWRNDDEVSTPRGFVKREMSPSLSVTVSHSFSILSQSHHDFRLRMIYLRFLRPSRYCINSKVVMRLSKLQRTRSLRLFLHDHMH
jgi:hypothetical protein